MKKIIIFFLFTGLIWGVSCKPKNLEVPYEVAPEGILLPFIAGEYTPVSVIWYRKSIAYKCFTSVDEIERVIGYLENPEQRKSMTYRDEPTLDNSLFVYYLPSRKPVRIPFALDDSNKEVVTTKGRSKELYRLFMEKKEREDYRIKPAIKFPSDIPVSAVWVKEASELDRNQPRMTKHFEEWDIDWVPYKCFNSVEELKKIIQRFDEPEVNDIVPHFTGKEILVIWYIPPTEPVRLTFSTDSSTKDVITAKGISKELYWLFTKKERRIYSPYSIWTKENLEAFKKEANDLYLLEKQPSVNDINLIDQNKREKKQ